MQMLNENPQNLQYNTEPTNTRTHAHTWTFSLSTKGKQAENNIMYRKQFYTNW